MEMDEVQHHISMYYRDYLLLGVLEECHSILGGAACMEIKE
jgi:hypothetical protein